MWEDNIKMDFNTRSYEDVAWNHLIRRTIMYFRTEKKKDGKYLDHLSKCHVLKKDRAACNWTYLSGAYYVWWYRKVY